MPLTRDQRIVAALTTPGDDGRASMDSLAQSTGSRALAQALPVMMQRHGVMLTLEYLNGKESANQLKECLERAILASVQGIVQPQSLSTNALARIDPVRYLAIEGSAVEAATWLKRLVEASATLQAAARADRRANDGERQDAGD